MNFNKDVLFFFSCLLIAFILPLGSDQLISTSIIFLGISWLLHKNLRERVLSLTTNKFFWLFSSLYLLGIVGLTYTNNLSSGSKHLEITLSLFLMPLFFTSTPVFDKKKIKYILFSFVAGCLTVGLILLFYNINKLLVAQRPMDHLFYYDIYYSFTELIGIHSVYFSMYLTFCITFLILHLSKHYRDSTILSSALTLVVILLFIFLILVMASRMQIIILFISVSVIVFWITRNKLRASIIITILCLFVVFTIWNMRYTYYQYAKLFETELNANHYNSSKGDKRMPRWVASMDIIRNNLLIGVGTGDVIDELIKVYKKHKLTNAVENRYNAHNQYLEIFIRCGIVGLLIFISTLFIPIFIRRSEKLYIAFLIIVILSLFTESMLERQKGIVFYSFFNSLLFFNLVKSKFNP